MPSKGTVVAVSLGAMAAQLPLLVLQGGVSSSQAAWGWSSTPQCVFSAGTCSETGANMTDANTMCTPVCANSSEVPSDPAVLACPGTNNGTPAGEVPWYGKCGAQTGDCARMYEIGDSVTCGPPTPAPTPAPASGSDASSAGGLTVTAAAAAATAAAAAAAAALGMPRC